MLVKRSHLVLLDGILEGREGGISTTFSGMGIGKFEDVLGEREVWVLGELDFTHDGGL